MHKCLSVEKSPCLNVETELGFTLPDVFIEFI